MLETPVRVGYGEDLDEDVVTTITLDPIWTRQETGKQTENINSNNVNK